MTVRIVKHNGKIKIQYKFLWWWSFMTKVIYSRDRNIEGDEINNDRIEHEVFSSIEEAEIYLTAKTNSLEILKQIQL